VRGSLAAGAMPTGVGECVHWAGLESPGISNLLNTAVVRVLVVGRCNCNMFYARDCRSGFK